MDPTALAAATVVRPRSRRLPAVAGVVALAAVAAAYVVGARAPASAADPLSTPATRFVIAAPPGTQLVTGHRELAIWDDGQQVAFIARGTAGQHIYVRRLDTLEAVLVPGTDGARDVAFSPDGRWLAFHGGNRIRKIRVDGSLPIRARRGRPFAPESRGIQPRTPSTSRRSS